MTLFALKSIYKTWKDIDLYIGGLLEKVPRDRFGKNKQVGAALSYLQLNKYERYPYFLSIIT